MSTTLPRRPRPKQVGVVVMGDVGRSPRMQYHAWSIASMTSSSISNTDASDRKNSTPSTWLIGHEGEKCMEDIEDNPRIRKYRLSPVQIPMIEYLYVLSRIVKAMIQTIQLMWTLLVATPRFDTLLVQNPPSIPLLLTAVMVKYFRGSKLIIDWHNLGFTMIATSLHISNGFKTRNPVVVIAYYYEKWCAKCADGHFTVSDAMKTWVSDNFGIRAATIQILYDRAPSFYKPTSMSARHHLFRKIGFTDPQQSNQTRFTTEIHDESPEGSMELKYSLRSDRPALLVSSTSWTADEDFGILLEALLELDKTVCENANEYPSFVVIVTGKGPQRNYYLERISKLNMKYVEIYSMWLEAQDYRSLLGAADLGISLHTSTSGKDLPMKVVDMFGCNLPVCAIRFECLHELVSDGENGYIFNNAQELYEQLCEIFGMQKCLLTTNSFQLNDHKDLACFGSTPRLQQLRNQLYSENRPRWEDQWKSKAAGLIDDEQKKFKRGLDSLTQYRSKVGRKKALKQRT